MIDCEQKAKYAKGDRVEVFGWTKTAKGTITDLRWIYHRRLNEHTWGYAIEYDKGQDPGLTFLYVPQGYIKKLEEQTLDDVVNK